MDTRVQPDLDNITTLNCSQDFFFNLKTGHCSPTCGVWEELPHNVVVVFKVAHSLVRILNFTGRLMALTIAVCNYKIM